MENKIHHPLHPFRMVQIGEVMSEFIRTYAMYEVAIISFALGMLIGFSRGKLAGFREQTEIFHRQAASKLWQDFVKSAKGGDNE